MGTQGERHAAILDDWMHRLKQHKAVMGHRDAVKSELGSWLELIDLAAGGDEAAAHELYKLVALHARAHGSDARPPSAVLLQIFDLEAALAAASPIDDATQGVLQQVKTVAVDAHGLGNGERIQASHDRQLRDGAPVIRAGDRVIGFLIGPMSPGNVDAVVGRVLRVCVGTGATTAVLDIAGAEGESERFHRILGDIFSADEGRRIQKIVITGAADPDASRERLAAIGADLERIEVRAEATDSIGA